MGQIKPAVRHAESVVSSSHLEVDQEAGVPLDEALGEALVPAQKDKEGSSELRKIIDLKVGTERLLQHRGKQTLTR